MPTAVWKGSIVLSLVSIPVKIFAAARSERIYLHQLHKDCHTRLRQPLFCPTCNRIVDRSEVVKGYEIDEGHYVLIEDEEIKKLAAQSSHQLEVVAFAKMSEIDPLFFDSSYFCIPEDEGKKPYQLIVKTLEETKKVAIGKLLMHQRDYTVFIRPYEHGLTLHTMYFANEVRHVAGYGATDHLKVDPREIKLAEQLVESLTEPFNIKNYHDEFQARLKALIEAKQEGKTIEVEEEKRPAKVIDMMTALKKSLEAAQSGAGKKVQPARIVKRPAMRKAG